MGDRRAYRAYRYDFGKQLLALRTRAALTQGALAEQCSIHRRSVQNWEAGVSFPKAETLQRLIGVLLDHRAFAPGSEAEEAQSLWKQAVQDGPHALHDFDMAWFALLLAKGAASAEVLASDHTPQQATGIGLAQQAPRKAQALIDWGEAIAVPMLYGRDEELVVLSQWLVDDRCRVVAVLGLGGIGKSSLAIAAAHHVLPQFDVVLFRSLQNGPPLAEVLDQAIHSVSDHLVIAPGQVSDKIALLVQLFRERRCLFILDNLEAILQPGAPTGTYRTGYDGYSLLIQALSEREHQGCLLLTSREKPSEIAPFEGRTRPVRSLTLTGVPDHACRKILETKDIVAAQADIRAIAHLYGGNPLALQLVAEPIRELFGGDIGAFLVAGDAFFNGVGMLMTQQFTRSTTFEQAVLRELAIEREPVSIETLQSRMISTMPQRELLVALESLSRRNQIERGSNQPVFSLQPVILEFVANQLVGVVVQEILEKRPLFLQSHVLVRSTSKDYIRRSQELLLATPILEQLAHATGSEAAVEHALRGLLPLWHGLSPTEAGYGPGNVLNLLRVLCGDLRGLDLSRLVIRQAYLQDIEAQDASLSGSTMQECRFTETFDAIQSAAISSTGVYWAAGSRTGEVQVWTADGMILHRAWQAHADMVWALAWSPDGRLLATSGTWDRAVKLWDIASGRLLWSALHASHEAYGVAFSPDGRLIASSGSSATVQLWDAGSGVLLQSLEHTASAYGIAWSPDGQLLASGDIQGQIYLWQSRPAEPAQCIQILAAHTMCVYALTFAPGGGTLASASWDGLVKLWEIPSGQLHQTFAGHTDRASRLAWSGDGQILASASRDQTIRLWDVGHGKQRAVLHGHTAGVADLAFTPDSRSILSGGEDGALRVWDAVSGQCVRVMTGYASALIDVDWSPDGAQLISGGSDTLVTIFDAVGEVQPHVLRGHGGVVLGVGWSADGRWTASSEWDNTIRLWDPVSGACLQILHHPDDSGNFFDSLSWSPDGRWLASGASSHGVLIWDAQSLARTWIGRQSAAWCRHLAWSSDGRYLAGGGEDGTVYLWDVAEDRLLFQLSGHQSMVTSVAWSPDGALLASSGRGSDGGEIFVWDTKRGERLQMIAGYAGMIYAVVWGPRGDLLVSCGSDGLLCWWDMISGECLRAIPAHRGSCHALKRSQDGTRLASCGDDGAIRLWDLETGAHHKTLRRDRPYERMDITGLSGITEAQRESLFALGTLERAVSHE
jgi:WD40 repeat protein/transcriptional regulator with XRE-family HTH domain